MKSLVFKTNFYFFLLLTSYGISQNNLALNSKVEVNSISEKFPAENIVDGSEKTFWSNEGESKESLVTIILPGATEIKSIGIFLEGEKNLPIRSFEIQTLLNGQWKEVKKISNNKQLYKELLFETPILTDRIRVWIDSVTPVKVKEIKIFGEKYIDDDLGQVKKILVNQSGYNLNMPKRFTAPDIPDGTPFKIVSASAEKRLYKGTVKQNIGDFSNFNPESSDEFKIVIDSLSSYSFRIAPYWIERVTYQNMLDFMIGARHYVGSSKEIRRLSWAWRDGDFFNWALQSLVSLYLSNPEVFKDLERKIEYIPNKSYPENYHGKWGVLEPYKASSPDIVKLIHWDVDVKVTQGLEHEMQKAELAYFLYAFPFLKQWLPNQNFEVVYEYVKNKWTKDSVSVASTTQYDRSPEHNLLKLKTKLGSTKGELPPGFSVIPNLLMYEVAKRQKEKDSEKYFKAAYQQVDWMINNLDWQDPDTTKGQRMSEHITMRALAFFYNQYPEKSPAGLYAKVKSWAEVAVSRSKNMWDFRKYTDQGDWVPAGWNETGNVLGFPASAVSAMSVLKDESLNRSLEILAWSHIDNAFGRNPTGRHFSYNAPKEIEGVEQGWYSFHRGGIGQLEDVRFVFDGSPKTNHYPNHPEIGNLGWTEGWVQFNTAFNLSMAYLTNYYTDIDLKQIGSNSFRIELKAPVNMDEDKLDKVEVTVKSKNDYIKVLLEEESPYSKLLIGTFSVEKDNVEKHDNILQVGSGDLINVSYGLGFFRKSDSLKIN